MKAYTPYFYLTAFLVIFAIVCTGCSSTSSEVENSFPEEKDKMYANILSRIDSLDAIFEDIRERANMYGENVRPAYRIQLSELLDERQRLELQLEKIAETTEENWHEVKGQVERELLDINNQLNNRVEGIELEIDY